jgi:tetratricopeptide (TPR) repeat protein
MDQPHQSRTHPDPQVEALIAGCRALLRKGPDPQAVRAALQARAGELDPAKPTPEQLEGVFETVCRLCDEGNFSFAAPVALHLVATWPTDSRFSFVAGTCLQRLGLYSNAAQLFAFTLVVGNTSPATLYRLGECLLAIGDTANASTALEAAFDLSRGQGSEDAREIQAMSEALIETIKGRATAGRK